MGLLDTFRNWNNRRRSIDEYGRTGGDLSQQELEGQVQRESERKRKDASRRYLEENRPPSNRQAAFDNFRRRARDLGSRAVGGMAGVFNSAKEGVRRGLSAGARHISRFKPTVRTNKWTLGGATSNKEWNRRYGNNEPIDWENRPVDNSTFKGYGE